MKCVNLRGGILYALVVAMSLAFLYYNFPLGLLGLILCCLSIFMDRSLEREEDHKIQNEIDLIRHEVEVMNRENLYELPIPMVIVDDTAQIWLANQCFEKTFHGGAEAENSSLAELTGLKLKDMEEGTPFPFKHDGIDYCALISTYCEKGTQLHLVHIVDMECHRDMESKEIPNETVFCYILIDNYDDIIEQLPSHERSAVLSRIALSLTDWASRRSAFILDYENDHYVMVFNRDELAIMEENKFKILDEIREMDETIKVTLSMGIGISNKRLTIAELDGLSKAALDIALARGGDQCVVRTDEKMSFYGGKTEATEKRTKVKARVKAHALRELIKEAENILIMGHQTPDMDCVGAAVGIMGACRAMGKDSRFVLKEINYSISSLLDYLSRDDAYNDAFITPAESEAYIKEGTLLIIVDTQSKSYVEMPKLTERIPNIVVIDHHRRSGIAVDSTMFSYIETYASSTCELVTELMQYFDNREIVDKSEANALLAGMCMDTKMFTVKTGVRTFEAASYLKRRGADTIIAKTLLQNDLQTYAAKSDAVRHAWFYDSSIAISSFEDNSENAKVIAAQAADELLNIKGINASFIILKNESGILISGRSMGEINVQLILEKLGGGGHLAIAGAQLHDVQSLKRAEEMLIEAIEIYKEERE